MFFLNQQKDTALYQELIRENVITAGLWDSLHLPSEGHLMDILIGNREKINIEPWLNWMIRDYDCTRIPGLVPDPSFVKELPRALISEAIKADVYPLQTGRKHVYIGLGRPDNPEIIEKLKEFYKKEIVYLNALDLEETAILRNICKELLGAV